MLATWSFPDLRLPLRQITTLGFEIAGDEQDILASRLPIEIDFKTLERPNSTKKISQLQKCKQLTNVMLSFTQKFNTTKKGSNSKSVFFHFSLGAGSRKSESAFHIHRKRITKRKSNLSFRLFGIWIWNSEFHVLPEPYDEDLLDQKVFLLENLFFLKTGGYDVQSNFEVLNLAS